MIRTKPENSEEYECDTPAGIFCFHKKTVFKIGQTSFVFDEEEIKKEKR